MNQLPPMQEEFAGPVCGAWASEADICEHDSCWDITTNGGSSSHRRMLEALRAMRITDALRIMRTTEGV